MSACLPVCLLLPVRSNVPAVPGAAALPANPAGLKALSTAAAETQHNTTLLK
jgi:hypothetical protein